MPNRSDILAHFDDDGSGSGYITEADQKAAAGDLYDTYSPLLVLPGQVQILQGDVVQVRGDVDGLTNRIAAAESRPMQPGPTGQPGIQGPPGETGPVGPMGTPGISQTDADARYVNTAGDTMTGRLFIDTSSYGPLIVNRNANPAEQRNVSLYVGSAGQAGLRFYSDSLQPGDQAFLVDRATRKATFYGPVDIAAPTAVGQAAQVTAIDPTTGRLAIGGIELGDTGLRNISTLLAPLWRNRLESIPVRVRRVGAMVTLSLEVVPAATAGKSILALPTGFRAPAWTRVLFYRPRSTVVPSPVYSGYLNGGDVSLYPGAETDVEYTLHVTYAASDAWPTTLPGVPV